MESSAELENQLVESITLVRTIKQLHLFELANFKTEQKFTALLYLVRHTATFQIVISTVQSLITGVFTTSMLWLGTTYVMDAQLTAGELFSFYAIINYFIGPVGQLISANRTFQDASIAADRLFEIMDLDADNDVQETHLLSSEDLGNIAFRHVTFAYGGRTALFENISFTIPAASITVILGENGSGKSSIAHLIQKTYPIQNGTITINDLDIKYIRKESFATCLGIVSQQVELFSNTILHNIVLDDTEADTKRVIQICKDIGLHDFIESLPNGYSTVLSENGFSLSGGQRQRLAIARALYRNPRILILDEATSALDIHAEKQIVSLLYSLKSQGITIIIITHRVQIVQIADKVLLLEKGKISAEGIHSTLLTSNEFYQKFLAQSHSPQV